MPVESLRDLLWLLAIAFGWLAVVPLGGGWYARNRFRALLKAPLTEEVEHLTHVWEKRVYRWSVIGLSMSGFSVLGFLAWLISGVIQGGHPS